MEALTRRMYGAIDEDIQRAVLEIVKDVLGCDSIAPEDDFFELGGHSLTAMQVVSHLHRRFGIRLPLRTIFESASMGQVARAVAEQCQGAKASQAD
jgi:acyl carrier protein